MIFLLGAALGSFLNVVISRGHRGKSLGGRSRCQTCRHVLAARDLIPLISFLWLRGRCRYCRKPISLQYPLVELAAALLLTLLFVFDGLSLRFAVHAVNGLFLLVLFVFDLRYREVPDEISLPACGLALLGNLLLGVPLVSLLLGGALGLTFFGLQFVISKGRWIGDGDIRLGLLAGFSLGLPRTIVALVVAYLVGAVIGLWLLGTRRARLTSHLPFGTMLTAAIFLSSFAGSRLIEWYLDGGVIRSVGLVPASAWLADHFMRL